ETETVDQWTGFPEVIHLPVLEVGKYVFPFDMTNESIRVSRGYVGQYPKHDGIDFSGPFGTEIFASADGKVIKSEESTTGDGNHVVIEHANGYYTLYAHCSELLVKEGDEVKQGDVIAKIGCTGNSTGNHLHFEFGFGYGSEPNGGLTLDPYTAISTRCAEDLNGVSISGEYQQTNNNSTVQTSIENEQYYTAQAGDSPISIAKAHKLNVDELYAMNPDIKENGVLVGDKVRVTQPIFGWPTGESPTGEGVRISRGFVGQYPEHNGVDIAGPKGTDILASADGRVIKAYMTAGNYGNYIVIQHTGGYRTLYAHCSELLVKMGDYVNKGDVIAKMGSSGNATGNQLRFEIILENDVRIDPYTKW
ncbi:MAG: peptidoglycan DD-metalloendopeptidase family protein, partial [Oscillospiraceae bacterium]|nr:peptidoglycan DD-metalloendopeptidase family protein [Oscillospiraceae bacterium]